MGTAVAEAQKKVNASIHLPEGYTLKWTGDFENQQRATKRLSQVVPVSIAIIFIILFVLFSNARDAGLVLLNVPFAAVGGIIALLITHFNFSISAGIGFIALFGICIQNGVIMISDIKHNIQARLPLPEAIQTSMRSRIRPVVMTAAMAASHWPDTGSYESWYRVGITTPLGYCHHRRTDRSYFLRPFHFPADCGSGIRKDAV